jgi:ubiquinone/menaquinone biosynthesis C-methylase UbiE
MADLTTYFAANKALWNKRAAAHLQSGFYDMKSFRDGKNSLNKIELELMGDVKGKKLLHLQCHFGQDTLSWARLGADVTGVDLSDESIKIAQELSRELNIHARFIGCNVYDLEKHLDDAFDIVFTSYGSICWLPDIDEWARLISRYLKKGGTFLIADFHPVLYMLNFETLFPQYSYFNTPDPIFEEVQGSYADAESNERLPEYSWNHSLSEIWSALKKAGLTITEFREFDYSPYNAFPGMIMRATGEYVFERAPFLPLTYAFAVVK